MSRKSLFVKCMDFLGIRPFMYVFAIFFYGGMLTLVVPGILSLSTVFDYILMIRDISFLFISITIFLRVIQWMNIKGGTERRYNRLMDALFKSDETDNSIPTNSDEKNK